MTLQAVGLTPATISERAEQLTSGDWSHFSPAEQAAFAYARKQVKSPSSVTVEDFEALVDHVGMDRALATVWLLANSHRSARVAEAFQLPLENENVFEGTYTREDVMRNR